MRFRKLTIPFIILGIVFLSYVYVVYAPYAREISDDVLIPKGASLTEISRRLSAQGIIRNEFVFKLHATIEGKGDRLKSGTYRFPDTVSIDDVIDILWDGSHQVELWVTIPEGTTTRGIASIFRRKANLDSATIVRLCSDAAFLASLGVDASTLEGYLMPDTYRIRPDDTEANVLAMMAREMQRFLSKLPSKRRARSIHDLLSMASLVEGETSLDSERTRVAGVYYNRLRRNMLLQADPTIQYVIPDGPRRLLYRDLAIDSPYNTYKFPGLPPGPVNNPGRKSILAALKPETHSFLYFVADGKGGHKFSRTANEHAAAVAEYRMVQRQRRGER